MQLTVLPVGKLELAVGYSEGTRLVVELEDGGDVEVGEFDVRAGHKDIGDGTAG